MARRPVDVLALAFLALAASPLSAAAAPVWVVQEPPEPRRPQPLPPELIKEWEKAGAEAGWMKPVPCLLPDGSTATPFEARELGEPGELPAFRFTRAWDRGAICNLSLPSQPFGLFTESAALTDDHLRDLTTLRDLQALVLHCPGIEGSGLQALNGLPGLERLDIARCPNIANDSLRYLAGIRSLRFLSLGGISNPGMRHVARLTNLETLDLRESKITSPGIEALAGLFRLRALWLPPHRFTPFLRLKGDTIDAALLRLGKLKNLESLVLAGASVSDAGLAALAQFENLRALDISGLDGITEQGLKHLEGLKGLQQLNLTLFGFSGLKAESLKHLAGLTELRDLCLTEDPGTIRGGLVHLVRLRQLQRLDLSDCTLGNADLKAVASLTSLRSLSLNGNFTDAGLEPLGDLLHLETLDLTMSDVTGEGLVHLAECQELRELRLPGSVTDDGLKAVAAFKNLRELAVGELDAIGPTITAAGLKHLSELKELRRLALSKLTVTESGLEHLARLENLRHLSLSEVTGRGFKHVADFTQLESLWYRGNRITDQDLAALANLKQLREVRFTELKMTDRGAKHLAGLKRLRHLYLPKAQLTDGGLKHLGELEQLRSLILHTVNVTDAGISRVASLHHLETLTLSGIGTGITPHGMSELSELRSLQSINLGAGRRFKNAALEFLPSLKELKSVSIRGMAVDDEGLKYLANIEHLQRLDFNDVTVGEATLSALRSFLPHCEIRTAR